MFAHTWRMAGHPSFADDVRHVVYYTIVYLPFISMSP